MSNLDEPSEQLAILLEYMCHGIVIYDGEERICLINRHVSHLFGFPAQNVVPGNTLASYIDCVGEAVGWPAVRRSAVLNNHRTWLSQGISKNLDHHYDDGKVLEISFHPLPSGGAVLTFVDVTHERNLRSIGDRRDGLTREAKVMLRRVSEIASDTRIVALNASIEASRLGGEGRGFAAVAEEVRSLSRQTSEVLVEIGRINEVSLRLS